MNGLTGATIKDHLRVRIPGHGIPTVAFIATVGTGAIASRTFEAGQIAPEASIPIVASFATTEDRASITRFFETDSVVTHCLTTVYGCNCQGLLDGSISLTSGLVVPNPENSASGCSW